MSVLVVYVVASQLRVGLKCLVQRKTPVVSPPQDNLPHLGKS